MSNAYKKAFKQELKAKALALAEEIGTARAAPKLGIKPGTLLKWRQKEGYGSGVKKITPEEKAARLAADELRKLKRENEDLKKTNFILRELATAFSKGPLSSDLCGPAKSKKKPKAK